MHPPTQLPAYTVGEEIANSITHAVGVILAIAGLAILTAFASVFGSVWHVVGCSIYGATQVLLYMASTLYHSIQHVRAKAILRACDHSAIFLLIAGTYTPFSLVNLRGPWGWFFLILVWTLALLGIAAQSRLLRVRNTVTVGIYMGMSWIAVFGIKPLTESVAFGGLVLLFAGGLAYMVGSAFYIWRRLPYHHAVWHLFVLAGSTLHFFAVLFYVIPLAV